MTKAAGSALRSSLRRVFLEPVTALAIVVSLALGIGVTTAAFAFLDDLLLTPSVTFSDPSRVLQATWSRPGTAGGPSRLPLSHTEYLELRNNGVFLVLAATQGVRVLAEITGRPERVSGEMVSANYFLLAGKRLVRGRGFGLAEDGAPGTAPVAVLSHDLWVRAFGANEKILGRQLRLNGHTFTVIGVAEPGFRGTNRFAPADLWVPLCMYRQVFLLPDLFEQRNGRALFVFGRLRPGIRPDRAESEVRLLGARLAADFPPEERDLFLEARSLTSSASSAFQKRLRAGGWTAMAAAAVLLLIACLDIANLLLVRARARAREAAMHLALGAGRGRLAWHELSDGLLLAALGGALAGPVALATRQTLWRLRPSYLDERVIDPGLHGRAFLFAMTLTLLTALLCSAAPLIRLWRIDPLPLLREAAGPDRPAAISWLSGQALIVAQVALSTVCLGLAALFLGSLFHTLAVAPGFEPRRLVLASFDLQLAGYDDTRIRALQQRIKERLDPLPLVESVGVAENRVLGGFRVWRGVSRPGDSIDPQAPMAGSTAVDGGYFATVGIPLLQGRTFAAGGAADRPAVILNKPLAQRLFSGADAVGRQVVLNGETAPYEVIGVVASSSYLAVGEDPMPHVYLPLEWHPSSRFTVHVRTSRDPDAALASIRASILEVDPQLPVDELITVGQVLRQEQWMPRMSAWLLSLLAGLALALAGLGVYGVASAAAQRRYREIGLRMALGARRGELVGGLLARGLGAVGAGLALGLVLTFWSQRWVRSLLYDAGSFGWPAAAGVASVLLLAGAAAHLVPALRATGQNPALALRRS
jgi:predicted permease